MDEISIVSRSSDPVDKSKSACLLRFSSMCGTDEWKQRSNNKIGRSSGRIQNVPLLQVIAGNRWRKNWTRVEYFPRIFVIADSSENPGWFARAEHKTRRILQTGSSSCQCSTTSIGQEKEMMEFAFRIWKKSRNTRRDSRKDTGRFWFLEMKRSVVELFLAHLKENEILQQLRCWNDSKIQVIQYSRVLVLWVVEFWKRRMAETPYTSMRCFDLGTLVANHSLCKSAECLPSSYELVWTIRLDRGRKRDKKNRKNPWLKVYWHAWNHKR